MYGTNVDDDDGGCCDGTYVTATAPNRAKPQSLIRHPPTTTTVTHNNTRGRTYTPCKETDCFKLLAITGNAQVLGCGTFYQWAGIWGRARWG